MVEKFFESLPGEKDTSLQIENKEELIRELLKEKYAIIRSAAVKKYGSEDFKLISQILYRAIFEKDVDGVIQDLNIQDNNKFPQRISTIKKELNIRNGNEPCMEEFVALAVKSMTQMADYENCVFPGVQAQIENMARLGKVRIWTAGDTSSVGQLKKIALSEVVNDARNEVAAEKFSSDEYLKNRTELVNVSTAGNKIEILPSIVEELKAKGIKKIVVIEDILKNLLSAEKIITESGVEFLPVWIKSEEYKDVIPKDSENDLEYFQQRYNASNSINDVSIFLENQGISKESQAAFIIDFDGVIMDSNKKLSAQGDALFKAMQEKGWM